MLRSASFQVYYRAAGWWGIVEKGVFLTWRSAGEASA